MKKLVIAGLALSLLGGTAVQAATDHDRRDRDRYERRDDRRDERRDDRYDRRDDRGDVREERREMRDARRDYREERRDYRRAVRRYHAGAYHAPRGYHNYRNHQWRQGQRLPQGYYGSRYVIRDYDRYGLYAPPRGYQWNRVGDDAILVAVAGGVIGAVVASLFF